jgi:hypothetical protein
MKKIIFLTAFLISGILIALFVILYFQKNTIILKNSCSDSSQCKFRCLYTEQSEKYIAFAKNFKPGDKLKATGICETNNSSFKCASEVKKGYIYEPIICIDPQIPQPTITQSVNYLSNKWNIEYNNKNFSIPLINNPNNQAVVIHGYYFFPTNHLYLSYSIENNHFFSFFDLNNPNPEEKIIKTQQATYPLSLNIPVSISPDESYLLYISQYEYTFAPLYVLNINTGDIINVTTTVKIDYRGYSWNKDEDNSEYINLEYYKVEDPNPPVKFSQGQAKFYLTEKQLFYQ